MRNLKENQLCCCVPIPTTQPKNDNLKFNTKLEAKFSFFTQFSAPLSILSNFTPNTPFSLSLSLSLVFFPKQTQQHPSDLSLSLRFQYAQILLYCFLNPSTLLLWPSLDHGVHQDLFQNALKFTHFSFIIIVNSLQPRDFRFQILVFRFQIFHCHHLTLTECNRVGLNPLAP